MCSAPGPLLKLLTTRLRLTSGAAAADKSLYRQTRRPCPKACVEKVMSEHLRNALAEAAGRRDETNERRGSRAKCARDAAIKCVCRRSQLDGHHLKRSQVRAAYAAHMQSRAQLHEIYQRGWPEQEREDMSPRLTQLADPVPHPGQQGEPGR